MRARIIAAAVLVGVALAVVASTASGGTTAANSITVWLQTDADKDNWKAIIKAAKADFQRQHPGVAVDVQFQTWGNHLQKFDATLAGGNAPDVIEMGNTEMTKYMAAGAFQDLTSDRSSFPNSSTWLDGLAARAASAASSYGVPYYAGSSVVTYRTDLFKKAKIKVPTSLAEFTAAARKLARQQGDRGFSPVYIAGHGLVRRDELRLRPRRLDREAGERQVEGHPRVAEVDRGLDGLQELLPRRVPGEQDDRRDPARIPYDVYAQGKAGSMVGPGWFSCCVGDKYKAIDRAVRDAEPHQGPADAGLPRRLAARRAGRQRTRRSRSTGSRPTRATRR